MRMQFESAGVWTLMRKQIAAANYTKPGDPLRIDCGYRPNGVVRMFQAVSLEADSDAAKLLAFSARGLREGVDRVEKAVLELTAIVEPIREPAGERAGRRPHRPVPVRGRDHGRESDPGADVVRSAPRRGGRAQRASRLSIFAFGVMWATPLGVAVPQPPSTTLSKVKMLDSAFRCPPEDRELWFSLAGKTRNDASRPGFPPSAAGHSNRRNALIGSMNASPTVGVVMGSKSDYDVLLPCLDLLREFAIPHEARIVSAHRTPDWLFQYAEQAEPRGLKIIIAAAGGAAHLPGMIAAKTILPVLAVPVPSTCLQGIDSLLSIVQMPKGVPVATLAIGKPGAANAALLAVAILAGHDAELGNRLRSWREARRREVLEAELPG